MDATVTARMVRDEYMAPGVVAPYQIQRCDCPPGWLTWADHDNDSCIRKRGAVSLEEKAAAKAAAAQRAAAAKAAEKAATENEAAEEAAAERAAAQSEAVEEAVEISEAPHVAIKMTGAAALDAALPDTAHESNEQRLRANQLFGARDYAGAAEAYGSALASLDELSLGELTSGEGSEGRAAEGPGGRVGTRRAEAARILANRAACHLKLQDACSALTDAARAVELDPSYGKAHYRLAHALSGVGRHAEAHQAMAQAREKQAREEKQTREREEAVRLGSVGLPTGSLASADRSVFGEGTDAGANARAEGAAVGVGSAAKGMEAGVAPLDDDECVAEEVAKIIEALKPTLAGSETRRARVEELHALLSRVSKTNSKQVQKATARSFAQAKGPQVLWEIENSMRGNWVADAKNGTMSKISKIFELPGAVCKAAMNHRKLNSSKQGATMCTPACTPDDDCCWAAK